MVEQSQEYRLAMPFVCPAALFLRRRDLCGPRMFRALGNLPRPESWLPYVFTSIDDPQRDRTAESPLSARKGGKERNREAGREVIPLESHTGAGVRGSLAHLKALRVVLL